MKQEMSDHEVFTAAVLQYPFDSDFLLKKSKKIRRALLTDGTARLKKKIAVLGGSTTHDIVRMMELFLLGHGIEAEFYESEYAQYYEDAVFGSEELDRFQPDLVFIHTTFRNLRELPSATMSADEVKALEDSTFAHFEAAWNGVRTRLHCPVIQNNFDLPPYRLFGNSDASDIHGTVRFVNALNARFADYAAAHDSFYLHDLNYLSACYGLDAWQDEAFWSMYKYAMTLRAIPTMSFSVANIIKSVFGKNKKALVLDLDNTLWGGIVGDDGPDGLEIGEETAQGETFRAFQAYLKRQKEIGVLLAVDSKNDEENALAGLNHPAGVLRPDDFVEIKANWEPKHQNFIQIAQDIAILPESMVFVDDNPAERAIVRDGIEGTAVPEIGRPEDYIRVLDRSGFFEVTSFTADDAKRAEMYRENAQRRSLEATFADYGDYLRSLDMKAEIGPFKELFYPRITQLTNKSNQFNLTTKRYTEEQIRAAAEDPDVITLYGRLEDRFGDNGIVSLVVGSKAMILEEKPGEKERPNGQLALLVDLWLMSCRVLKRDMEFAMMDELVRTCMAQNIRMIFGYYYPTAKNGMVREFYDRMGFQKVAEDEKGNTTWKFEIPAGYEHKNRYIRVNE